MTGIAFPKGVTSTLAYDAADRLLSIAHVKSGGMNQTFSYTYDAAGNRLTATDPGGTTTYSYDNLGQLRTVQPPSGPAATYNFDAVGNRTEELVSGVTAVSYTYDAANRVRTRTAAGATTTYSYDPNGNRTGKQDQSGLTTYTYNVFDRLTSITAPGGSNVAQYTYTGDGLRTRKVVGVGMTTTNYTWDVVGELPNVLSDGDDYVWGQGLIGQVKPAQGMNPEIATYAHQDGLGSIRLLTDSMGADVGTQQYDAYGAPVAGTGITLPFGFTGEQQDAESGLVYLRARYMDPASGRFLTLDLVPGVIERPVSFHGFTYVANSPVRRVDPTGEDLENPMSDGGSGIGGPAGGGAKKIQFPKIKVPKPTVKPCGMMALRRFWFEFDLSINDPRPPGVLLGCGVTARDFDDAETLLRERVFMSDSLSARRRVVEDVDIRTLEQLHVVPNMAPPNRRGIWFPLGYA